MSGESDALPRMAHAVMGAPSVDALVDQQLGKLRGIIAQLQQPDGYGSRSIFGARDNTVVGQLARLNYAARSTTAIAESLMNVAERAQAALPDAHDEETVRKATAASALAQRQATAARAELDAFVRGHTRDDDIAELIRREEERLGAFGRADDGDAAGGAGGDDRR
jgi:hypothetical protein